MTDSVPKDLETTELIGFDLRGQDAAWAHLHGEFFEAVQALVRRVVAAATASDGFQDGAEDLAEDIAVLAASWAKAKLEKPSLENERLRAEIAHEYAQARQKTAEALKPVAEMRMIESQRDQQAITSALDSLERILRIMALKSQLAVGRIHEDLHAHLGPPVSSLGTSLPKPAK